MAFADDLSRYGPDSPIRVTREQAIAYCAHLTSSHYENFSVVSWLTPRRHRAAFQSIYAFCRWSDDLGDEIGDPVRSRELLAWWRDELHAMYGQKRTSHPVMIALADTVERYRIPIGPFEALISAFEQDQIVTEYETYDQLRDYCTRSANPVGHLVLHVAGAFNEPNARLSDATCTALQLANFWQDVARDLAIGRIYLPREDRDRFGYADSELRQLKFTPRFAELMQFEVDRTRLLFDEGRPLVARIPGEMAVDIDLFSRGGLAILDRIVQQNYDVLSVRPALTKRAKLGLLLRAMSGMAWSRLKGITSGSHSLSPEGAPSDSSGRQPRDRGGCTPIIEPRRGDTGVADVPNVRDRPSGLDDGGGENVSSASPVPRGLRPGLTDTASPGLMGQSLAGLTSGVSGSGTCQVSPENARSEVAPPC